MEEAFINYLLASPALTALVGNRITWGVKPQSETLPAITLHKITANPVYSDEGEGQLSAVRMQVDSWGGSYGAAKNTAREVMATLSTNNGAAFEHQGVDFSAAFAEDEEDSFELDAAGHDLYRTRLDFILWHD